ncbi:MAG TPA: UDP-N-acetylmuramoyl-L-alanine--D-glutamate ligase, partial [Armatimonadetes bacterium]|nr:UDP-N-acetylmuramoyl-L-alanine--D-glutamate ligase [Armatimonadota bacterium]
ELRDGDDYIASLSNCDIVVLSPGVPPHKASVQQLMAMGIPVVGEIELAYHLCKARIIAVTGTNGKTTTATLIHHILTQAGYQTALVGNVGKPFIEVVEQLDDATWVVMEVSSFQLMTCEEFRPHIAIVTNVTIDHMDWHTDRDEYLAAKAKLLACQRGDDWAVLNADDAGARSIAGSGKARCILFGLHATDAHVRLEGEHIVARLHQFGCDDVTLFQRSDIRLLGKHNLWNAMAGATAAYLTGVDAHHIAVSINSFDGVEHRLELVLECNGVKFVNDSAATSPHACLYGLRAFDAPLIWIAGGRPKVTDFSILRDAICERVKAGIFIGEAAHALATVAHCAGVSHVVIASSLKEAVSYAFRYASSGDVVLFSPACASFDMFDDYKHRGEVFKQLVHKLIDSWANALCEAIAR